MTTKHKGRLTGTRRRPLDGREVVISNMPQSLFSLIPVPETPRKPQENGGLGYRDTLSTSETTNAGGGRR